MSNHNTTLLALILAMALIRGVIYAAVVPPWQAPDEPAQFERAKASLSNTDWYSTSANQPAWYGDLIQSLFIFDFWGFVDNPRPTYQPELPLNHYIILYHEAYGGLYGSRLAYAMIGWPLLFASNKDITYQLYWVRLNNVLMNVAIILLAWLITQTIFPNNFFLGWGVPLLILFNPQHTHLLSTVNNGNLAELLSTLALYYIVKGIMGGFSAPIIGAILLSSLLAMWTKATAYFLPFTLAALLFQRAIYPGYHRSTHSGTSYWRGWLAPKWMLLASLILFGLIYWVIPQRLTTLISNAFTFLIHDGLYLDPIVPLDLFRSFWAYPGWFSILLPDFWYGLLAIFCLIALVGLIRHAIQAFPLVPNHNPQIYTLLTLAIAIVTAMAILLSWNAATHSTVYRQGRSIYPVIVPISLFLMLGWQQLIPSKWRSLSLLMLTLTFFLFDSLVLLDYIIPFFYSRI